MKQLLSFVRKEFYHIFRDRRTMMILLGMPIAQIILFGFAITTEVNNSRVGVLDPSRDRTSLRITELIDANKYFDVTAVYQTMEELNTAFRKGEVDFAMVFCPNFEYHLQHTGKAQVQLISDATNPNVAVTLTGYASNILLQYQQSLLAQGIPSFQIKPEVRLLYNPQMKSSYNFVPGVMGMILMLICAMMTSISIVREKETGTMEVLLVSPIKPLYIILAKAVPYFVLSFVNLVTILLLSVYVLDVPVAGSLVGLTVISLIFIVVCLALGLLISTISASQIQAMLISGMALMMPVMLLSGMMFPTENMPLPLRFVSNALPATWYIAAVKKIMIEGLPMYTVIKEVAVLCLMALVLVFVSLKNFKNRLA